MTVELLTDHYLEFLSLKGGCTGSSESALVKMPHCWKSHVTAQLFLSLSRLPDDDRDICVFDYYVDESGEWDPWISR